MSDSRDRLRNDDDDDDLLADIGAALAVEPSPGFRDGVQRRIAEGASRARFAGAGWWQVLGMAAGVAAVIVVLAVRRGPEQARLASGPLPAPQGVATRRVASTTAPTSPVSPVASGATPATPARHVAVVPRQRPGEVVAGGVSPAARPDLVVLTNQPALLRRMWAGLAGGVVEAVDAGRPSSSQSPGIDSQIAITELTVAPIVIPDVTAQTAPVSGAGGAGVRRVISAEQSARSR